MPDLVHARKICVEYIMQRHHTVTEFVGGNPAMVNASACSVCVPGALQASTQLIVGLRIETTRVTTLQTNLHLSLFLRIFMNLAVNGRGGGSHPSRDRTSVACHARPACIYARYAGRIIRYQKRARI